MSEICWKIKAFWKFVWYEAANAVLKWRLKRAWARLGSIDEELDRIKSQAN